MPDLVVQSYPPYDKQQEIIDALLEPSPIKKQIDLCCGRGFGKTYLAIIVAIRALSIDGKQCGLFLEPSWSQINSVFWPTWRALVPKELYKVNKGEQKIIWITGSELYYGPRNVSGNVEAMRDKYRGMNLTFAIDDEAAVGCDEQLYTNILAAIRVPSTVRFYFTISTPKVGTYRTLVTGEQHVLYRGSSRDNPYLPDGHVDNMLANMTRDQARREIDGEFVSLEGRIWKNADLTKSWPEGTTNHEWSEFKSGFPFWILSDLGSASGAFVIVQQMKANYRGQELFRGNVWVAVADLCPQSDGSASRAFQVIKKMYGTPVGITAGDDSNTRESLSGKTLSYYAQQTFGNVPIYPCNESVYSKRLQGDNFDYLLRSGADERRFTVASNFREIDPDSKRGVIQMLEVDEWAPMDKRNSRDVYPKDSKCTVQHCRDALLMGFSQLSPLYWGIGRSPA